MTEILFRQKNQCFLIKVVNKKSKNTFSGTKYCGLFPNTTTSTTTTTTITSKPVDGEWSDWSWSSCSKTCGKGTQTGKRKCVFPEPYNKGEYCPGSSSQTQVCNNGNCAGEWSSWSYGSCSKTCVGSTQTGTRKCVFPDPNYKGDSCPGSTTTYKYCNKGDCVGRWGSWGSWSGCTHGCCGSYCTPRTERRTRICYGGTCPGKASESRSCPSCPSK